MTTTNETPISAAITVSDDIRPQEYEALTQFLIRVGAVDKIKPEHNVKDAFSTLVGGVLKVISIQRGKISCSFDVKSPILNAYGGMHGGAIAAVAERVATACVRTIIGKENDIFLSELSISYLSTAPENVKVVVDGCMIRSGRNLTFVAVNFRLEESGRLVSTTHTTFYNMPVSSL